MKQSVLSTFPSFTTRFEGRVSHMYLDVRGLVTIGLGCLIDPESLARSLPFVGKNTGERVPVEVIALEWRNVKASTLLAKQGHTAAARVTTLKLEDDAVDELARVRLRSAEDYLKKTLKDFESWPADAQLATLSMAWAMGAGFTKTFSVWTHAALQHDWAECARQCLMRTKGNPGLVPRNKANVALFLAASTTATPDEITDGAIS